MSTESTNLINSESSALSFNGLNENEEVIDIPSKFINEEKTDLNESVESERDLQSNNESEEVTENVKDTTPEENSSKERKGEWEDLLGSGSLMKKIVKEGEPHSRPQRLEKCRISYECTLEDGTVVEKLENFELLSGDCEVIQGLDLAIGLMNVGEICELKIHPRLAYGSKGLEPKIPGDATVHYRVELLSAEPEEELENLTVEQRKIQGNKKRERGNWWYGRGENTIAIQCYRRALDYLDEVEGGIKEPKPDNHQDVTDAELQALLEDRLNVCNNMAAAQIKLGHFDAALNSLQTVLRCQPDNVKALFRKAKVYKEKNNIKSALQCLQKANEVSPSNPDIQKEINVLNSIIQKQKITERELARRMLNGPKSSANDKHKKKGEPSKLYMWFTIGASVAVGLVGFAAYRFKYMPGF